MENQNIVPQAGRSIGKTALIIRERKINKIIVDKNMVAGWKHAGSHWLVYLKKLSGELLYEEYVLVNDSIGIVEINCFLDIIERELEKR